MIGRRDYGVGDVILREGEMGETAYLIERGRVQVTKEQEGQPVHLAYIRAGSIFGEMGMIDDRPRSATVTAVEPTRVFEIYRDDFLQGLQDHPEVGVNLLKVLFERLRESQSMILRLQQELSAPAYTLDLPSSNVMRIELSSTDVMRLSEPKVFLRGLTRQSARTLPSKQFEVTKFPFRIGRQSEDPLANNDLLIDDTSKLLHVSRHHVALVHENGRIGVIDRGSTLGALIDNQQIGGGSVDPGPVFFSKSTGTLVLGDKRSPFRYEVIIDTSHLES